MDAFDTLMASFATLETQGPSSDLRMSAVLLPGRVSDHLARSPRGTPCFLLASEEQEAWHDVELQRIIVKFGVRCTVELPTGSTVSGRFAMIECKDAQSGMASYFIRVVTAAVWALPQCPNGPDVRAMVRRLTNLFASIDEPAVGDVLGLWAELFVIAESGSPASLFGAWRERPSDAFDFNAPPQCLEVKATLGEIRKHHFSLRQLVPAGDATEIAVASFLMRVTHTGLTVRDLMGRVGRLAGLDAVSWLRLEEKVAQTLGQRWRDALDMAFDETYARERLAVFRSEAVPQVVGVVPPGVSDVRFVSDLSFAERVDPGATFEGFLRWLPGQGSPRHPQA